MYHYFYNLLQADKFKLLVESNRQSKYKKENKSSYLLQYLHFFYYINIIIMYFLIIKMVVNKSAY